MKSLSILLVLGFSATTKIAQAQVGAPVVTYQPVVVTNPFWLHPGFGNGLRYQRHASTAAEGYLRGRADLLRGQGQYNLLTAEARRAHAQARQQEIANHEKSVQTYFSLRDLNKQTRQAERGPRATNEQIHRIAASTVPEPLSPSDVDWASGEISWPQELSGPEYASSRADFERAFAQRAALGQAVANGTVVEQAANGMLAELKTHVREISPQQYMTARRFIESLAHELEKPSS